MGEKIRSWKQQHLTKCGHPGCYHPLTHKRLAEFNFDPILFPSVEGGGAQVIAGECVWDPRHRGGLQWIPVRKPDDET